MIRNKLTQDAPTLFMDQYGDKVVASSLKELRIKVANGGGRVFKVYTDRSGRTMWCGYGIGHRWFTAYKWREVEA